MKVIFLDHDGVMCLSSEWGSRHTKQNEWGKRKLSMSLKEIPVKFRFDDFNINAVKILNEILDQTGAEIVTSSDWRFHGTLEELQQFFEIQGVKKGPIAFTEHIKDIEPSLWAKDLRFFANIEKERSIEILDWVKKNSNLEKWVAIDDLDMSPFLNENFVHSHTDNGIFEKGLKEIVIKKLTDE